MSSRLQGRALTASAARPRRASAAAAPGRRAPMRADAQRNYERLLSAAAAVFAEHGADDASLEEIARRAGVGSARSTGTSRPGRRCWRPCTAIRSRRSGSGPTSCCESDSPGDALAAWLRAMVAFSSTKHSLTTALLATLGKESELLSSCSKVIRDSADALLGRAQKAGVVRADVDAKDVIRLVHAVNIATQHAPTDPAADRPAPRAGPGRPAASADQLRLTRRFRGLMDVPEGSLQRPFRYIHAHRDPALAAAGC